MNTTNSTPRPRLAAVPDTVTAPQRAVAIRWARPTPADREPEETPGRQLVPAAGEIPADYPGRARWLEFARRLIDGDLAGVVTWERDDIPAAAALWHLSQVSTRADLVSEHRQAAIGWLASLWLDGWVQDDALAATTVEEDGGEDA
jgi:hypothetical protein